MRRIENTTYNGKSDFWQVSPKALFAGRTLKTAIKVDSDIKSEGYQEELSK